MIITADSKVLRKAMIDKGINTITELSKSSGVSRPKIHEFMREEVPLSTTFIRLCNFLEINASEAVAMIKNNKED